MSVPMVIKHGLLAPLPAQFSAERLFVASNSLFLIGNQPGQLLKMPLGADILPEGASWTAAATPPRYGSLCAVAVDGNLVYFAGGRSPDIPSPFGPSSGGPPLAWLNIYDADSDQWSQGPDLPGGTWGDAAAIVGRTLYVSAVLDTGSFLLMYDLDSHAWSQVPVPWRGGASAQACAAIGTKIYLLGGSGDNYSYDTATSTWSQLAASPTSNFLSGAAMVVGSNILLYEVASSFALWAYATDTNSWSSFDGGTIDAAGWGASASVTIDDLALVVMAGGVRTQSPQPDTPINPNVEFWGFDLSVAQATQSVEVAPADPKPDVAHKVQANLGTVFGTDDRCEIVNVTDPARRAACQGIGGVIEKDALAIAADGSAQIQLNLIETLDASVQRTMHAPLAPDQKFATQPCAMVGTCFRIDTRLVATAAHVVSPDGDSLIDLSTRRIVFGWGTDAAGVATANVPASKLYEIVSVKRWAMKLVDGATTYDWAILETDRDIDASVPILPLSATPPAVGDAIWGAGHGMGLPMKYSAGQVRATSDPRTFQGSITEFAGNSGGPVLNPQNQVVGITTGGPLVDWTVAANLAHASIFDPTMADAWINMQKIADVRAQIGPFTNVLKVTITIGSGRWSGSSDPLGVAVNNESGNYYYNPGPFPRGSTRDVAFSVPAQTRIADLTTIFFKNGGEGWQVDALCIDRISVSVNGVVWFTEGQDFFWVGAVGNTLNARENIPARWGLSE